MPHLLFSLRKPAIVYHSYHRKGSPPRTLPELPHAFPHSPHPEPTPDLCPETPRKKEKSLCIILHVFQGLLLEQRSYFAPLAWQTGLAIAEKTLHRGTLTCHCEVVVSSPKQSLFSTSPEVQKETPKQSWRPHFLLPLFSTHRLNTGTGDFGVAPNTKENPQSLSFVPLPDPGTYSSPRVFHHALKENQALLHKPGALQPPHRIFPHQSFWGTEGRDGGDTNEVGRVSRMKRGRVYTLPLAFLPLTRSKATVS